MALGYENTGTGPNIIANAGNAMAADIRRVGEQIRKDILDHKTDKQVAGLLSEAQTISPDSPTFQQDLVGVLAKYPMAASDPRAQVGLKMLGSAWQQKQDVKMMEKRFGLETDQWNERHPTPRLYGEEPGGLRKPFVAGEEPGGLRKPMGGDGVSPEGMAAEPTGPNDMFRAGSGMMGGLGSTRGGPLGGVPFTPPETAAPSDDLLGGRPPQVAPAGSETLLSPKYQRALDTYRDEIKGQVEAKKGAADVARYRADLYKQQLAEEEKGNKADNELRPVPPSGRVWNPKSGKVLDLPLPEKEMTPYQTESLKLQRERISEGSETRDKSIITSTIREKDEQLRLLGARINKTRDLLDKEENPPIQKLKELGQWQKQFTDLQTEIEGLQKKRSKAGTITTRDEFDALPSGATYIGKDGGTYQKP